MKIVFFGTADFAVPSLEALVAAGHEVLTVVTQPDKPQGRGMQLAASPVKRAAEKLNLALLQPKRVRSAAFIQQMQSACPDLLALAAFGQIVPQALLDIPSLGPINVHGSLLPRYRGAAPIQRAIMNGETVTGVTTMWMDATLDTGDILLSTETPILPEDTSGTLFARLADIGARLLLQTIEGLAHGSIQRTPQDNVLATMAPMLTPEDGAIRWNETAEQCVNRVRGVSPRPGAFALISGKRVKIWRACDMREQTSLSPGTVAGFSKSPAGLRVAAGEGSTLLLLEAQPENGKRMSADAWARGLRLDVGAKFD